jgi:hypothetical protein
MVFRWCLLIVLGFSMGAAQTTEKRPVTVPENVAALVRPILDLLQESFADCGQTGLPERKDCLTGIGRDREQKRVWKVGEGIGDLSSQKTPVADEALVVLMCYYTGESGDNEDAVINRGRRELPYLLKYRERDPVMPRRNYSGSMLLRAEVKGESFHEAIDAIRKGEKRD